MQRKVAVLGVTLVMLTGCMEGGEFAPFKAAPKNETKETVAQTAGVEGETRDVEAPEVFGVIDQGLWDGRPSLGGVWVAHPDVMQPERVIIRNKKTNKTVIGALFRRERLNPGPIFQVSSDAADALGMLAGAPADLSVIALRREVIEPVEPEPAPDAATAATVAEPDKVETTTLDPIANASAAIDEAVAEAASEPAPAAKPAASKISKPYVQIGIFSVEKNAEDTATAMRNAGLNGVVKEQKSQGKTFWRVIVGPAGSNSERNTMLKKVKELGFADAYFVGG